MSDRPEIVPVGTLPPVGVVPEKMHAQLIRPERFGEPEKAFQIEQIPVPQPGPREVLVGVMAAGVNYNNVWAALGYPVNVIGARNKKGEPEEFHIGGSDASGIVYAVGSGVTNVKVGDEVVVHCGMWDHDDPFIKDGGDPMFAPSQIIWGYESNWGSFAQFCKVQDHQCLPKPPHLNWEQAAAYMLVGATAYRMLHHWKPNDVKPGMPVLIWGGAGGLGAMAIQIVKAAGGIAVAIVSENDKFDFCKKLGADGVINRKDFDHWGALTSEINDPKHFVEWTKKAREFGKAIWEITGKKNPGIVFEHPGESTLPTSAFVCETGGMIVICAGTTGFNATVDLRYLWMRQKRLQGSHFANDDNAKGLNDLVIAKKVDPVLSRTFKFEETGACHQLMKNNQHPPGNMSILVGAEKEGLGAK